MNRTPRARRTLPVLDRAAPRPRPVREAAAAIAAPSRFGRWRAATLIGVYVLMGLHIAHWKIAGRTLAPLELNEVMYTLELGVVTAGFLFMLVACVATAIFGRFFCSWGCHILALEDLCAWLLERIRIRPKPVRSRLLLLVPPVAMLYMFAWPQFARVLAGRPLPQVHTRSDAQGWASFMTENFWRNLPEVWVALLTFGVCGFLIVYVLGSRSFCTYACPYGAVFRIADRFAPGRIVAAGDCSQCGICTAVCSSHVRVHEELLRYGTVVNPACMRDLDCVSACPEAAVKYGLTRPPLLRGWFSTRTIRPKFDFSWREELLMLAVLLATLFTFRGLYESIPFLLTLGLGGILAYAAVLTLRLVTRRDVRLNNFMLRRGGRLTRAGGAFVGGGCGLLLLAGHSAFIRFHEFRGHRTFERVTGALHSGGPSGAAGAPSAPLAALQSAAADLEACARYGLLRPPRLLGRIAVLHARIGEQLADGGRFAEAAAHLRRSVALAGDVARTHYNLAVVLGALGREAEALREYEYAARLDPADADICNNLGFALARAGDLPRAERCFRAALARCPDHAAAHFNLGRLFLLTRPDLRHEARQHLRAAQEADPRYAEAVRALAP